MFARTPRLTLRPGWPEDAPALTRAIAHEGVVTGLGWAPWPYALGDAQLLLERVTAPDTARFLIFDDPAGRPRLVGGIGIDEAGELGCWLTPDAWGRGYATEAGRAVLQIARHALRVKRLRAGHFHDNPAATRVLEKLCFRPTGRVEPRFSEAHGIDLPYALYEIDLSGQRCDGMKLAA